MFSYIFQTCSSVCSGVSDTNSNTINVFMQINFLHSTTTSKSATAGDNTLHVKNNLPKNKESYFHLSSRTHQEVQVAENVSRKTQLFFSMSKVLKTSVSTSENFQLFINDKYSRPAHAEA